MTWGAHLRSFNISILNLLSWEHCRDRALSQAQIEWLRFVNSYNDGLTEPDRTKKVLRTEVEREGLCSRCVGRPELNAAHLLHILNAIGDEIYENSPDQFDKPLGATARVLHVSGYNRYETPTDPTWIAHRASKKNMGPVDASKQVTRTSCRCIKHFRRGDLFRHYGKSSSHP